jgi:hypothetical protein
MTSADEARRIADMAAEHTKREASERNQMTKFTPPIRRKDTARGHKYEDAEGRRVPGVTTILSDGIPKPALVNWAASATAEYAVDNWDRLTGLSASVRLKELNSARWSVKDTAANKGTAVHALAEKLVAGEEVEVPDELVGHAESYARFLDDFEVEAHHVEFSVVSYRWGYAGTGDLIANVKHVGQTRLLLLDVKTNRSGVFGETALQMAAYRYADVLFVDGGEEPMPVVDGCAAVHVRADGYDLIPVIADEAQHKAFLHVMRVAEAQRELNELVGPPVKVPASVNPYRLTRAEAINDRHHLRSVQ